MSYSHLHPSNRIHVIQTEKEVKKKWEKGTQKIPALQHPAAEKLKEFASQRISRVKEEQPNAVTIPDIHLQRDRSVRPPPTMLMMMLMNSSSSEPFTQTIDQMYIQKTRETGEFQLLGFFSPRVYLMTDTVISVRGIETLIAVDRSSDYCACQLRSCFGY